MSKDILSVENITMQFGGVVAVNNLSLHIPEGQIVALIGPNGAGKTTVFNLLTGVYVPTEGAFYLCGQKLNGKQTYQVVEAGIARTFQNIRLFKAMTVLDNVKIAFTKDIHYNLADSLLRTKKYWNTEQELTEKAMEYLRIVHLDDKAGQLASSLPYGQQRKLEIARALATNMKLLQACALVEICCPTMWCTTAANRSGSTSRRIIPTMRSISSWLLRNISSASCIFNCFFTH